MEILSKQLTAVKMECSLFKGVVDVIFKFSAINKGNGDLFKSKNQLTEQDYPAMKKRVMYFHFVQI